MVLAPPAAKRSLNALAIQIVSDRARGFAGEIVVEDAANHTGLRFVDGSAALLSLCHWLNDAVAISSRASSLTLLDSTAHGAGFCRRDPLSKGHPSFP